MIKSKVFKVIVTRHVTKTEQTSVYVEAENDKKALKSAKESFDCGGLNSNEWIDVYDEDSGCDVKYDVVGAVKNESL